LRTWPNEHYFYSGFGIWIQGLAVASQMLYHLSHAPALSALVIG
jgi:hypothetical protein